MDKNYYNTRGMNVSSVRGSSCGVCGTRGAARHLGCGCQSNGGGEALLARIREIDFAIYETVLYLDVYPCSSEALAYYHSLICEKEAFTKEYESKIGPLTAFGNLDRASWNWVKKPWPWEYSAN